jgi:RecB family exonuclease
MPLSAVRSSSNRVLWDAFVAAFLAENADRTGPGGFVSYAWLTHRIQRDALYREAAARGVSAWLGPPVAFLSDLPRLFDIRERPVSLWRRQQVLDEIARRRATELGAMAAAFDRPGVGRAHDHFIGELLPEGVTPESLAAALTSIGGDDFSRLRSTWIVAVYRDYLAWLATDKRYDARSVHALAAEHIAAGELKGVLQGCRKLHVYGLTTQRTRHRLLSALRDQGEVEVVLYVPGSPEADDWDAVADAITDLSGGETPAPIVQPSPDERRELDWVALEIKKALVEDRVPPDRIAVIARSGREDARAAHEVLSAAGIPTTSRLRSSFAEVPALKAVLLLFRAAARDWPYRQLRQVLASPYFDITIDLRRLERIAGERRVSSLDAWSTALKDEAFTHFAERVRGLSAARPLRDWITLTRELLDPGLFAFRRRVCRIAPGRTEVVRLDQQAIESLDGLLRDWAAARAVEVPTPFQVRDWYGQLRRFLHANEIALGTPLRTGVQVLEAHEAALFPFDRSYIVHANDGEFPKRPGTSWLFTDAELGVIRLAGLPLSDRADALRRERILWRAVTAGPRVAISYRTADPSGVPLLPSLLVPEHDRGSEIPRTRFVWDQAVTPAYADRLAMRHLQQAKPGMTVIVPRLEPVRRAIVGAVAETERRQLIESRWSGRLFDPWVLDRIAQRFTADFVWSASRLEAYSQNPFVFLVAEVLGLEAVEEAEEETSPMSFGSAAHAMLERFYGEYTGSFPGAMTPAIARQYQALADRVLDDLEHDPDWLGLPLLWALTRRDITRRVEEFLAWELPRLKGRQPHLREYKFGYDESLSIEGQDTRGIANRLRIRGRIDRVDRTDDGALHVLDYKSSSIPTAARYADGAALQGALYMKALSNTVGGTVATAAYSSIKRPSRGGEVAWGEEECERALAIALSITTRVREGKFEPLAAGSMREWAFWWPGADVCRVTEMVPGGCRFYA